MKITRNLNAVQSFVRFVMFVLAFFSFGLIILMTASTLGLMEGSLGSLVIFLGVGLNIFISIVVARMFFVLPEWERLVLLRVGKFVGVKGPGFFVIPPFIYSVASIIDTRIITQQVEATATLTQDNVPTKVTAAIEFRIESPERAVINVKDYLKSVVWLSTEALKNTIGSLDLKELLSNRDQIAMQLRTQIDNQADTYGINVIAVRITDIDTPPELIEELAVIARARRSAQAKRIQAEAEVEVANKIKEASNILVQTEGGFKLREIQNLSEISKEESSMIIIYPSDSYSGKNIAHAGVSLKSNTSKNSQNKTQNSRSDKLPPLDYSGEI
ncbi:MAG: hypothetical protein GF347_00665 [Candidatus Moranbacteria bacterium]|nr:hypothetical protein [Candidatus Moranbacteria bacterium]